MRKLALNTDSANCRTFYVRRMRNREGVARGWVGPPPPPARRFQFLLINPTLINLVPQIGYVALVTSAFTLFKPCLRDSTSVLMRGDGPFKDDCFERFCIRSARSGLNVTFHMAEAIQQRNDMLSLDDHATIILLQLTSRCTT